MQCKYIVRVAPSPSKEIQYIFRFFYFRKPASTCVKGCFFLSSRIHINKERHYKKKIDYSMVTMRIRVVLEYKK